MKALAIGVWLLAPLALSAEPLFERVTVSSVKQFKTSEYPTVDRLADGRLFCVFSAIDEKATGGKAVVVGTFSEDHGRTWSSPIVLIDSRPELDYDPNIIVIGSRVIVTSTTVPPTHGQFISTSRTVAVRSDDHGKTWSKPYEIPMGHRYTAGKINRGIVLRDGTALFGYSWDVKLDKHEKLTSEGEEDCFACVMASKDRGTTWNTIARVSTGDRKLPDRQGAINGLDEPALVELGDGSIYMLCRTGLTNLYESRSKDGGATWSSAVPSPLTSHNAPASLCRFGGAKPGVLAIWCNSPTNRWPLCAAASFDDCTTWTAPRPLAMHEGFETSYPGCIEAGDGTLIAVWQENVPAGREIRAARFHSAWLLDGSATRPARTRIIVFFGDSTTAPRENTRVFVSVLADRFAGGASPARVINAGIGGNNTSQARERFDRDVLVHKPDVVTIFFGLNDSAVDVWKDVTRPRVDIAQYEANLLFFVRTLREKGARPILMTPNPVAWTPELRQTFGKPSTASNACPASYWQTARLTAACCDCGSAAKMAA